MTNPFHKLLTHARESFRFSIRGQLGTLDIFRPHCFPTPARRRDTFQADCLAANFMSPFFYLLWARTPCGYHWSVCNPRFPNRLVAWPVVHVVLAGMVCVNGAEFIVRGRIAGCPNDRRSGKMQPNQSPAFERRLELYKYCGLSTQVASHDRYEKPGFLRSRISSLAPSVILWRLLPALHLVGIQCLTLVARSI